MEKDILVYTDGGARGNPGPAGVGVVAYSGGKKLFALSKFVGHATNNIAEYSALDLALDELSKNHISRNIKVHLDSELLVKQISGEYKVRNDALKKMHDRVTAKIKNFKNIDLVHIKRDKNTLADKLVNYAIDNKK